LLAINQFNIKAFFDFMGHIYIFGYPDCNINKNSNHYQENMITSITKRTSFGFAKFAKYDYLDALNFKSLLNEEELMVI
jgi:hypothetical protein